MWIRHPFQPEHIHAPERFEIPGLGGRGQKKKNKKCVTHYPVHLLCSSAQIGAIITGFVSNGNIATLL
jgi:hypothetical protein